MRTTVTLADDVAAAVQRLRQERGIGLSEAVNELARGGLAVDRPRKAFKQTVHDMGASIDVTNIAEVIETVDGPTAR